MQCFLTFTFFVFLLTVPWVRGPIEAQYEDLIRRVRADKELLTGDFISQNGGVGRVARKWDTIAVALNLLDGPKKSGEKWKGVRICVHSILVWFLQKGS